MTQATHILIAGAVSKPFIALGSPLAVFLVSLLSHYISDAIPHGDYPLRVVDDTNDAMNRNIAGTTKDKLIDISKVGVDTLIGIGILMALYQPAITLENALLFVAVVLGGMLPDILQPLYYWFKRPPLTWAHQFHTLMHTPHRLVNMGYSKSAIISQTAIAFLAIAYIIYI
ncbi:MAG: hypothetical protein Q8P93_04800 [bacterium]|nr:hypothetical protein [bacterium]